MGAAQQTEERPETTPQEAAPDTPRRRRLLPRILAVAIAVVAVVAAAFGFAAYRAEQTLSANTAMLDAGATGDVGQKVGDTVAKAFSFDYGKPEETQKVVDQGLRGNATGEYEQLFAPVKQQAAPQKLVITTTVKNAGVISMSDGHARVLVFADQFAVRAGTDKYSAGPAQLEVDAENQDGAWRITDLRLL